MNESRHNTSHSSDDIDLILLLERVINYFRRFFLRYILAILLGIVLGIAVWRALPNIYESRMILHTVYLTNAEEIQIVETWDKLLGKGEYRLLSEKFQCDEKILHDLADLEAAEIQKVFTPNNPNGFYIDVEVKNNAILPELQKGIVNGLENTEYIKQKVETRRASLRILIEKVKTEITKLDSMKTTVANIMSSRQSNSSSFLVDISGITSQMIALNEKLVAYQDDLKFSSGIIVVQGFNQLQTTTGPSLKVLILLGLILCLAIAYISALITIVIGKLRERRRFNANK
jgi:hypothetical protein